MVVDALEAARMGAANVKDAVAKAAGGVAEREAGIVGEAEAAAAAGAATPGDEPAGAAACVAGEEAGAEAAQAGLALQWLHGAWLAGPSAGDEGSDEDAGRDGNLYAGRDGELNAGAKQVWELDAGAEQVWELGAGAGQVWELGAGAGLDGAWAAPW